MFELAQRYGVLETGPYAVLQITPPRLMQLLTHGNQYRVEQGLPSDAKIYKIVQLWEGPVPKLHIVLKSAEFPIVPSHSPLPLFSIRVKKIKGSE